MTFVLMATGAGRNDAGGMMLCGIAIVLMGLIPQRVIEAMEDFWKHLGVDSNNYMPVRERRLWQREYA